jgi:predicted TIM-barrel fold metal-dependent hydrolase
MSRGRTYEALRADIEHIPVIDTHEHFAGPEDQPKHTEPIASLVEGYYSSDLASAGGSRAPEPLVDEKAPTEEKWPLLEKLWARTKHTGYARVIKLILRNEYGLKDLTLEGLKSIAGRLINLQDRKAFDAQMDRYGIRCCLVNIWPNWKEYLTRKRQLHPRMKVLIGGPDLHNVRTFQAVQGVAARVNRHVTCLEEYLDAVREFCRQMKELGAVGIKDQSAYERLIRYDSSTRAEAQRLFGFIMDDPRRSLGWPEAKPLDDCIFHAFMRIARDLELPVQVHTGHMAGVRNDVAKTNAAHFRSVLELHQDVRFDLFHGNWPYAGDWLFLGKNYPNVSLNCCWLHVIDPRYSRRVLADALVTVPHSKIHGFGGDYGRLEHACAHLVVARDNIAAALAEMVDDDWLDMDEARQVAADWLFNNANEFYRLGLDPVRV